jgi:hypothetical protein
MSRLARIYSKEQENPPDIEQIGMLAGLSNYRKSIRKILRMKQALIYCSCQEILLRRPRSSYLQPTIEGFIFLREYYTINKVSNRCKPHSPLPRTFVPKIKI